MADKDANHLDDNAILAVNQDKITALLAQGRDSVQLVDGQHVNFNYRPFLLAWLAYERLLDSNHITHHLQHDRPINQLGAALLDPTPAKLTQARHHLKTNRSLPSFGPIQLPRNEYSYGYTQNESIVLNSDLSVTNLTIAQELRVAFIIFLTLAHETGHLKLRRIVAGKPPNTPAYNGALSGGGITPEKLPLGGESGRFIDLSLFELDHLAHSPNFHNLRADGIPHIRLDYIISALSAPIPPSLSYSVWVDMYPDIKLTDSDDDDDDDDAGPRTRGKRKRELDDAVEKAAKKPKTDTAATSTTMAGSPTSSTLSLSQPSPPLPAWMTVLDSLKPPLTSAIIHDTLATLGALTSRQSFEVMDYITLKPWALELKCAAADVLLSDRDPASFYLTDEEVAKWATLRSSDTLQHTLAYEKTLQKKSSGYQRLRHFEEARNNTCATHAMMGVPFSLQGEVINFRKDRNWKA